MKWINHQIVTGFIVCTATDNALFTASAIVGAVLLGLIETVVSGYISSGLRDLISFSLLILILLVRPAGLFGVDVQEKA